MKKIVRKAKANQLRIIGGQWRGRKLSFADGDGLRPTMDRVRETLFNWLQNEIVGARCLDMFSGSGALGLEALSRYAGEVVMIDKNPQAIGMIRNNLKLLGADNALSLQIDAHDYLMDIEGSISPQKFDIVFLDPPFNKQLVGPFCQLLEKVNCLSDQASIYIEIEKKTVLPELPKNWKVVKQKKAGQLAYYLVHVDK
ncbi:MAG: 16S rRNA (guanine(966)-N(2))-methyltransferase RsmD [gamma proteobacterium symbiont of Lucinoma myriamae]|nr:16S rRNA (guanine(966)-N(2))-methyltransferase RsmD [gamma proteobacterium symbiont of Lucinoma myriamae]MCU7819870.1 16S rRNA (guanine(966)-N(2))-methyltransferase RsmD [gamma proteobacterium symbiont of Lucinoma myriamae]MCU7831703.1 16S rRNA (guanine(966)-N(2))-methyltransferase RsmD [gamma proteobacterium symbiont of Lucinoma myriamae]